MGLNSAPCMFVSHAPRYVMAICVAERHDPGVAWPVPCGQLDMQISFSGHDPGRGFHSRFTDLALMSSLYFFLGKVPVLSSDPKRVPLGSSFLLIL